MPRVAGYKVHVTIRETDSSLNVKPKELIRFFEAAIANHPLLSRMSIVRVTAYHGRVKESNVPQKIPGRDDFANIPIGKYFRLGYSVYLRTETGSQWVSQTTKYCETAELVEADRE